MSTKALNWAWKQPLRSGAKIVLIALADAANGDGECYPGQMRLAEQCGMSERAVREHLQVLESDKYLTREERRLGNGRRTSDFFRLHLDREQPAKYAGSKPAKKGQQQPADSSGGQAEESAGSNKRQSLPVGTGDNRQNFPTSPAESAGCTQYKGFSEPKDEPKSPSLRSGETPANSQDEKITPFQEACRTTWHAYSSAYEQRYKVPPVRNAKINRLVQDLVKRLGAEESPQVAEFYLTHNGRFYVSKLHDFGLLVLDAEKLRTEWATNTRMTSTRAKQLDGTQSNFDAATEAKELLRRRSGK